MFLSFRGTLLYAGGIFLRSRGAFRRLRGIIPLIRGNFRWPDGAMLGSFDPLFRPGGEVFGV
jgi:hypothetical protein